MQVSVSTKLFPYSFPCVMQAIAEVRPLLCSNCPACHALDDPFVTCSPCSSLPSL